MLLKINNFKDAIYSLFLAEIKNVFSSLFSTKCQPKSPNEARYEFFRCFCVYHNANTYVRTSHVQNRRQTRLDSGSESRMTLEIFTTTIVKLSGALSR